VDYETFFISVKERIAHDLHGHFDTSVLDTLTLSMSRTRQQGKSADQYRSKTSKVPAYYNPNNHSVHLNVSVLEAASEELVENICYHELVHAASHHAKFLANGRKVLKSGLKIQVWDETDTQQTLHRNLNEGMTQYIANSYTNGGSAYRNEVTIVGKLIQRIGLSELRAAYFGADIDKLEEKVRVTLGEGVFEELSTLLDQKEYEAAEALVNA
jgi:hypothetical protein